jgi:ribosomal protein S18 acetylase RimI-like enzyme
MSQPTGWTIRQTDKNDTHLIRGLLASADWLHQHLDWLTPVELVEKVPFLIAFDNGVPLACLAAPPDLIGIAWIRLFAFAASIDPDTAWNSLWERARSKARERGVTTVFALLTEPWLADLLKGSGFQKMNEVITLEWRGKKPAETGQIAGSLREMDIADIKSVTDLDQVAFDPPWRLSEQTLLAAFRQRGLASVIEVDHQILGYQISTQSAFGIHLARIAVHPEWQDQAFGKTLVSEVQQQAIGKGFNSVTVNTQSDNSPGINLYASLGFRETGHAFPVYRTEIQA